MYPRAEGSTTAICMFEIPESRCRTSKTQNRIEGLLGEPGGVGLSPKLRRRPKDELQAGSNTSTYMSTLYQTTII